MTKTIAYKFNIFRFIIFIAGFIFLWICGDYAYSTFITHSGFVFSILRDILMPFLFSVPLAALSQLFQLNF